MRFSYGSGTTLDGILGSAIGLNPAQLTSDRAIVTENQGIMERRPRGGETWYDTGDISVVGQSPKGIGTNNATNVISTIGSHCELDEIVDYLSLAPYEIWELMEQLY